MRFVVHILVIWLWQIDFALGGVESMQQSFKFETDSSRVSITKAPRNELRLVANKAALQMILRKLEQTSQAKLHFSMLPTALITVACHGTVTAVLTCVLGEHTDMVFYHSADAESGQASFPSQEIWLLPLEDPAGTDNSGSDLFASASSPGTQTTPRPTADHTDMLLAMAKDPRQRMEAITSLAAEGRNDDLKVRELLYAALNDQNPGVRAQAIFALGQREGEAALPAIRRSLKDNNADVRRMALENVGDDQLLLQSALDDADAGIRQYAQSRLAVLAKRHEAD